MLYEYKEMSDVFELPTKVLTPNIHGTSLSCTNRGSFGTFDTRLTAEYASLAINNHDNLVKALADVHKLIVEASQTGFNCFIGDWADRLYRSQDNTFDVLRSCEEL